MAFDSFLMNGNPAVNIALVFILGLLAAVSILAPLSFLLGWLQMKPQAGRGALVPKGQGVKPEKTWGKARFIAQAGGGLVEGHKKIKAGSITVWPGLSQDLAGGFNPAEGVFVVLDGQLCGYDDGRKIHYRHKDMMKIVPAKLLWLAALGWAVALALPFISAPENISRLLADKLPIEIYSLVYEFIPTESGLALLPLVIPAFIAFIIIWKCLDRLRANTLVRRVEQTLALLDKKAGRPTPPLEKNPLRLTALAALVALAGLAAVVYICMNYLVPLMNFDLSTWF